MKLSNVLKKVGMVSLAALAIASCKGTSTFGHGGDLDKILSSKTLVVGTEATYAPFEYTDTKGNVLGYDVDVMGLVGDAINAKYNTTVKVVFKNQTFDSLITSLNANQIDLIAAAFSITDERKKSVEFSTPYFTAESTVVVKDTDTTITSMDALKAAVCGAQLGTVQGDTISSTKDGWNKDNKTLTSVSDLVLALQSGTIQALVVEKPVAQSIIAKQSGLKIVDKTKIDFDDAGDYGIATNYTTGDSLIAIVNEVIATNTANGKLTTLYEEAASKAAGSNA